MWLDRICLQKNIKQVHQLKEKANSKELILMFQINLMHLNNDVSIFIIIIISFFIIIARNYIKKKKKKKKKNYLD